MLSQLIKVVSVFGVLLIAGCSKKPQASDLIGNYRLTETSKTFLVKGKGYKTLPVSVISLDSSYRVGLSNLPDCATNGFGHSSGQFVSGKGAWKLEKRFSAWGLTLAIDKGGSLEHGFYVNWLTVRGWSPPYRLQMTIGDPDTGEVIVYEKNGS